MRRAGMLWLDLTLFGIVGFFIYPPVMLLPVMGLDFTSKKAVGTAAGFIGLFGYLGRTVQGKMLGTLAERYGWNAAFYGILASTLLGIVLLSWTWKLKPHAAGTRRPAAAEPAAAPGRGLHDFHRPAAIRLAGNRAHADDCCHIPVTVHFVNADESGG